MDWLILALVVPGCLAAIAVILGRSSRQIIGTIGVDRARDQFRYRREGLEASFLGHLGRTDPIERVRWEDAQWHDEVVWARDRKTGRLLALVGVDFESQPFDDDDLPPRYATVLFQYDRGQWRADAERLDEVRPHEALLHHRRYAPISLPPRPF